MNYCKFCNQEIMFSQHKSPPFYTFWFYCEMCDVNYNLASNTVLLITRFYFNLIGNKYCLDLLYESQTSQILKLPHDENAPSTIIWSYPSIIPGLTPDNCQDKIKTYITFL